MFCPTCGAQYDPSMRNCPSCGTLNNNPPFSQQPPVYQAPVYNPYGGFRQADPNMLEIFNQATSVYNFALVGLVLSFVCGFGWVFAIISHSKYGSVNDTLNFGGLPMNDYYVNEARKKLSTAKAFNIITLVLTVLTVLGAVFSIILNTVLFSAGEYYYY